MIIPLPVSCVLIDGGKDHPRQVSKVARTISCGHDNCDVGFIPNGRSTPASLTVISLLRSVLMRNYPPIQSKLRCPTRDRSDRFSIRCHTLKLLQVFLSFYQNPPLRQVKVLRMLSKYVGEDKFLKGISLYLKKHVYSNTVSRDLWEGIGAATGMDLPDRT
jgi:hypothetical protein